MMRSQQQNQQDYQSKILYELSSLVFNILRSPPLPVDFLDQAPSVLIQRRRPEGPSFQQISPAGFASLLLGISLSLMLCGSVTFILGFILMPWVLGLVIFFYFVGIMSSISMIGRSILCHVSAPSSHSKHIPSPGSFYKGKGELRQLDIRGEGFSSTFVCGF
ncbi:hypothetical protein CASFOL_006303 [Castilleja foliolosa]|uniref:Uncharacterized protein n=1 Tax=Castilleja foliolosa TaxID=1961234 RepID=A0ABD3E9X1_9LAMI